MDIAARPNLDIFQRDRAKGQQEKNQGRNNENRIAELVAKLKTKYRSEHPCSPTPRQPADQNRPWISPEW